MEKKCGISGVIHITALLLILFNSTLSHAQVVRASTTVEDNLSVLVKRCAPDISPLTMRYLVDIESDSNPYSLNVNRKGKNRSFKFYDALSAISMANKLLDNNEDIDMGLAQINAKTMQRLGLSVADMFNPCSNLQAGSQVLNACYLSALKSFPAGQKALAHALSCYNTGNFNSGIQNGYVAKLQKIARQHDVIVPELHADESLPDLPLEGDGHSGHAETGEPDAFSASLTQDAFLTRRVKNVH